MRQADNARRVFLRFIALLALAVLGAAAISCDGDEGGSTPIAVPSTPTEKSAPQTPTPTRFLRSPTPPPSLPLSESDAVWQQVAEAASSVEPILRPVYLPPAITRVWVSQADRLGFRVVYSDTSGQIVVTVAAGPLNPGLPGPNSLHEQVEVMGVAGGHLLRDRAEPLGSAYLAWEQPGRIGEPSRPDGPQLDYVTYLVSSIGLPTEELLAVANGLEPVER